MLSFFGLARPHAESFLAGVECQPMCQSPCPSLGGLHASEIFGPGTYYMGMIDILQKWTWGKRGERFIKSVVLGKDGDGISAVGPAAYRTRFLEAMGALATELFATALVLRDAEPPHGGVVQMQSWPTHQRSRASCNHLSKRLNPNCEHL